MSGFSLYAAAALLAVLALSGAAVSQTMAGDLPSSGWYVSLGVGASRAATMKQSGHNRDTVCYPTRDCRHLPAGMPTGFRWNYDLESGPGTAFEMTVGRAFPLLRLELAGSRQSMNVEQEFTAITYLDGSALVRLADSAYTSTSTGGVDDLTIHTLSLNAYYDMPLARSHITPYVGAGLGLAFVELSGLRFQTRYSCTGMRCERPERYNVRQDTNLSDTVPSAHLHAGADYPFGRRLLIGLKVSYNLVADVKDESAYDQHAIPGLTNASRISDIRYWSLFLNFKYLFRDSSHRAP